MVWQTHYLRSQVGGGGDKQIEGEFGLLHTQGTRIYRGREGNILHPPNDVEHCLFLTHCNQKPQ